MKHLFFYSFLSSFVVLNAQISPFKSYDVVIYPEYYFSGVMAEIEAEVLPDRLPLNLKFTTPSNTDSVFYVSGSAENPQIENLFTIQEGNKNYIKREISETRFRIFVFYDLDKKGVQRSSEFSFQVNHPIDDAHIVVQEPLVAQNFIFSEDLAESFSDQHGINFKRIHMYDYKKNSVKNVSFSYKNPTQDISINSLQSNLANPPNQTTEVVSAPIRHKLPLWQPLVVLGIVSLLASVGFYFNTKKETSKNSETSVKGKFCTKCGQKIGKGDKFCSNCGEKL